MTFQLAPKVSRKFNSPELSRKYKPCQFDNTGDQSDVRHPHSKQQLSGTFYPYHSRPARRKRRTQYIAAQRLTLVDFGIIKNTRIAENVLIQLRADMFNVFNHRNYGVPEGRISAPNFLDEAGTNGGNRRIILRARIVF